MGKTQKNISYSILYQLLILIIPLITAPYLSRVLGKEGIGIYTYTNSIAYYFVLFSMLGLSNYGNRAIAQIREDKYKTSRVFFQIYFMQIMISVVVMFFYFIFLLFSREEFKSILIIQTMYVLSAAFDVSWFFYGIEKFKKVLLRNTIFRFLMLLGIFIFIKAPSDVWKYAFIMSFGTLVSQIFLWFGLRKEVIWVKPKFSLVVSHIKPNLILFIPVIAVSIYRTMDKIMIGNISTMIETGLYENADKIVTIPMTLIVAIGTVMMPKMSNLFAKDKISSVFGYIRDSMQLVNAMSFGMCFGMATISNRLAPLYFGPEFSGSGVLIFYLSPVIIFASAATVVRMQYLIPKGKDFPYLISVIAGAVVNLVFNSILIKPLGAKGAVVGTLMAEFIVLVFQCLSSRKELSFSRYIKDTVPFLGSGIFMYIILEFIEPFIPFTLTGLFIEIILGVIIYFYIAFMILFIFYKKRLNYLLKLVIKKGI